MRELINDHLITQILTFILIILFTVGVARFFQLLIMRRVVRVNKIMLRDPTRLKFFSHVLTAVIYLTGFGLALNEITHLKPVATSLLAGAGVLTIAVGFASQNALSNIISGLFIVLFRPFGVNDRLKIKDSIQGVVEDITLRHTILRDAENKRVILPNSLMNTEIVTNYSYVDEPIHAHVELLLTHGSDILLARNIIVQLVTAHSDYQPLLTEGYRWKGSVPVQVIEINEKGIVLRIIVSAGSILAAGILISDLLEKLLTEFPAAGIQFSRNKDFEFPSGNAKTIPGNEKN